MAGQLMTAAVIIKLVLAYLLGGVMGGDVMRWLFGGGDLRAAGSGNVGATNALRTRGAGFALGVLAVDIGKGVLAVWLIPALPPQAGSPAWLAYACGFAAALGHCYPLFHGFRGGKGVATLAGVFAALAPGVWLTMVAAFALTVLVSGYVSLASLAAAAVAVAAAALRPGLATDFGLFCLATALLTVFKHRANIARLRAGNEPRFERARLLGRLWDRWRR